MSGWWQMSAAVVQLARNWPRGVRVRCRRGRWKIVARRRDSDELVRMVDS